MAGTTSVYSFDRVSVLMNAVPFTDFWEGDDAVKVIRNDNEVNHIVGADGGALVSISTDQSAIIEVKLKPSSPSNTVLQALATRFRRGLRIDPVPFVLTDFQTSEVISGRDAVIYSRPKDIQYGKNASARTWMIFVGCLTEATIGQI